MKELLLTSLFGFFLLLSADENAVRTEEFPKEELQKQKNQIATMVVKEISKTLPQKIDKYTTLVAIKNDASTLVYTFEINSGVKSDEAIIKEDYSRMHRAVTQGVCQSSSKFLEAGINTRYIYRSAKSKKKLFIFDINKAICQRTQ
jgi:hypothetical protein